MKSLLLPFQFGFILILISFLNTVGVTCNNILNKNSKSVDPCLIYLWLKMTFYIISILNVLRLILQLSMTAILDNILLLFCFSVTQSCLTLYNPMDCSMPDFPVLHYLLELAQTHVHWISDAFQPSHPLVSPSPPAFNLSQHQGLFQWVSSSHQVAKLLELQHQSFHIISYYINIISY